MAESVTHEWAHIDGSENLAASKTYSGGTKLRVTETIPIGATNLNLSNVTLDVSAVKAFEVVADQALLLEPNNGTTPNSPMTLVANVPYRWNTDSYDAFFFGTDWTALFVTNASGVEATLKIRAILDPTP